MAFYFNELLKSVGVEPSEVRLLRHADSSALPGRTPYELWKNNRHAFDHGYQDLQKIEHHAFFASAQYWATFAGLPNGDTVFLALYRVHGVRVLEEDRLRPHKEGSDRAQEHHVYDLQISNLLDDLSERLYIEWGDSKISWRQYAERQNKRILEFRRKKIDPPFPGYLNFIATLSELNSLPAAWREALRLTAGVYMLTCPRTKETYIGSASGVDGFLGRWSSYVADGHGGNVELQNREPSDYEVTILETVGTGNTRDEVLMREIRWKRKLRPALCRN